MYTTYIAIFVLLQQLYKISLNYIIIVFLNDYGGIFFNKLTKTYNLIYQLKL